MRTDFNPSGSIPPSASIHAAGAASGDSVWIDGIGEVRVAASTSKEVVDAYASWMQQIAAILSKNPESVSAEDAAKLAEAVQALKELARSGLTQGGTTYFPDAMMLKDLNVLLSSLAAAGFSDTAQPSSQTDALKRWISNKSQQYEVEKKPIIGRVSDRLSLEELIKIRSTPDLSATASIQDLLMYFYIAQANEKFETALEKLEKFLQVGQDSIRFLDRLRDIMNMVAANPEAIQWPPASLKVGDLPQELISQISKKFPANEMDVPSKHKTFEDFYKAEPQAALNKLTAFCKKHPSKTSPLYQMFAIHKVAVPVDSTAGVAEYEGAWAAMTALKGLIADLEAGGMSSKEPNTLPYLLTQVVDDIENALGKKDASGKMIAETDPAKMEAKIKKWVIDGRDKITEGSAQGSAHRLTQAHQAATNLNDNTKDDLRKEQYSFEEFYKSAAKLLSDLFTALSSVTRKIAG